MTTTGTSRPGLGGRVLPIAAAAIVAAGVLAAAPAQSATPPDASESAAIAGARGSAAAAAGQPYASHWFPNDLLTWDPATDPDAAFNRSTTPLADRVRDDLTRADPNAAARDVMALSVFANTSGNPSQGSDTFDYYLSEFWPYLDTLVFWGGSAGEGLILAPNPTVTDAAHRNGVPVYGTVFLPPTVYGGDLQWTRDLLQRRTDGSFPVAEKLVEVADTLGFEGWFLNAETEGGDEQMATDMREFISAVRAGGAEVLWYDSMVESGEIRWQNRLNELNDSFFEVSDLMFLNYGWNTDRLAGSAAYAESMGRDPAELFAGVDVGWRQFGVQQYLDVLFPSEDESGISLSLYRPDFTLTGTDRPDDYPERESRFWVGADGDPSVPISDADGFEGVSSKVAEHTSLTDLPFATDFGTGRGHGWWENGRRWQRGDWNNLSAQDVLPTWRWWIEGAGADELEVSYDYTTAYRGGSSLRVEGEPKGPARLRLFATRVEVAPGTRASLTTRGSGSVDLLLSFADDPTGTEVIRLDPANDRRWTTRTAVLDRFAGRTLTEIGLRIRPVAGTSDVELNIGRLQVGAASTPDAPSDVRVRPDPTGAGARVTWSGSGATGYQVEAVNEEGERTWLGTTTAEAFYARRVPARTASIAVVPLGETRNRGPEATTLVHR